MGKPMNKNNMLNGYLLLFIVFQGINLAIIAAELLMNFRGYHLMILAGGSTKTYSLAIICLSLVDIILTSIVVLFFLKRKQAFIKVYIASSIYKVLILMIRMTLFFPLLMAGDVFSNITKSIFGIAFNIVMLFFWLNYFKSSFEAEVYLKSNPANQRKSRKSRKTAKAKSKLKVIK